MACDDERVAKFGVGRQWDDVLGTYEVGFLVQNLGGDLRDSGCDWTVFVPTCVNDKGTNLYYVDGRPDIQLKLGSAVIVELHRDQITGAFIGAHIIGLIEKTY